MDLSEPDNGPAQERRQSNGVLLSPSFSSNFHRHPLLQVTTERRPPVVGRAFTGTEISSSNEATGAIASTVSSSRSPNNIAGLGQRKLYRTSISEQTTRTPSISSAKFSPASDFKRYSFSSLISLSAMNHSLQGTDDRPMSIDESLRSNTEDGSGRLEVKSPLLLSTESTMASPAPPTTTDNTSMLAPFHNTPQSMEFTFPLISN